MGTWHTRGLRGSALEELINFSNEKYKEKGLALIQKIPTPITPIRMDPASRQITLAYFNQKSTVDYIGAVQGYPVCFDAKECAGSVFSLANVHPHQMDFMASFENQKGIAFLILYFTALEELYYLPYRDLKFFWDRMKTGGRKSIRYEEIDKTYRILQRGEMIVAYLDCLELDLQFRRAGQQGRAPGR